MFTESSKRSFLKMMSWRVCATLATIIIVYLFVGRVDIAVAVGGVEVVLKMLLYYLHERGWNKIKYGRRHAEPFVLWFTGLPCSGKSTLAEKTVTYIKDRGLKVQGLDGDVVRSVLSTTGFSKEERNEHIKRVGFLSTMLEENGVVVVASFVSPYEEAREALRKKCRNYIEIYVDATIETCEKRDVKGMYRLAREGKIKNFTGLDDPYEAPKDPDLVVDTDNFTVEESFERVKELVDKRI